MKLRIKTPSRLHFGLLDLSGNLGRLYGSLGVALENPGYTVEIEKNNQLSLPVEFSSLLSPLVKKFSHHYRMNPLVDIRISEVIPSHCGLGSGTQLALAIACGLAEIYGITATIAELSWIMGRGRISAIGTASFEKGGFIIDGGQLTSGAEKIPPVILQTDFPLEWQFVVAIPAGVGLHSNPEDVAFNNIIPGDVEIATRLCQLVQMKLLPALVEGDIKTFGQALTELDKTTGLYFKGVQKRTSVSEITGKIVDFMLSSGAAGAGQSSWGPAVYCLVPAEDAEKLGKSTQDFLKDNALAGGVYCSRVNNDGAEISPF